MTLCATFTMASHSAKVNDFMSWICGTTRDRGRHVDIRDRRSSIQKNAQECKYSRKNSRLSLSCCCIMHLKAWQWIESHSFMRRWQFRSLHRHSYVKRTASIFSSLITHADLKEIFSIHSYCMSIGFQTIFAFIYRLQSLLKDRRIIFSSIYLLT